MGAYLKEARERVETIERLHRHSRLNALEQAEYQYGELQSLRSRASKSKRHQTDALVIGPLLEHVRELIEQIRVRELAQSEAGSQTTKPFAN